ncbi:MAG: hypothetical protein M3Y72_07645 [Acidobacteriota bacterium]|nr:hypothetical protein [Acidobacteriota bacterium]
MRRLLAALALILLPCPLPASEFDWLVREFARESGAKQINVPFFGLARFVVAVGHPAGTSDMKLAIFETGSLESHRFSALTDSSIGSSWKPMIRVRCNNGESTNIYARNEGKHLSLLITAIDGDSATFVQVRVQPRALIQFVDDHSGRTRRYDIGQ